MDSNTDFILKNCLHFFITFLSREKSHLFYVNCSQRFQPPYFPIYRVIFKPSSGKVEWLTEILGMKAGENIEKNAQKIGEIVEVNRLESISKVIKSYDHIRTTF